MTIDNTGTVTAAIDSLRIVGAGFELAGTVPTTIAAGTQRSITVRFRPNGTCRFDARLFVVLIARLPSSTASQLHASGLQKTLLRSM